MTDAPYPHCNMTVLHPPGECWSCDKFPRRQEARITSGEPFSTLEANGWSGNTAVKPGSIHSHMGATWRVSTGGSRGPTIIYAATPSKASWLKRMWRKLSD